MLTVHFSALSFLQSYLYFWYNFNKLYPSWLNVGAHRGTWGECHGMYLESQFPTPQRDDESIHFGISAPSEGIYSVYQVHTQTFSPKRAWHHWGIRWWYQMLYDDVTVMWGILMTAFTLGLKGYKRKNAWEGRGSKLRVHRVNICTLWLLRCGLALSLPGISINRKIKSSVTVSLQ